MIYAISPVIASSFPTTLIFAEIVRSPNRNPNISQSSASPLYKEILRFLPKLRKVESITKKIFFFCFHRYHYLRKILNFAAE